MSGRILVLDDADHCAAMVCRLQQAAYEVHTARRLADALAMRDQELPEVVVLSTRFPSVLAAVRSLGTAHGEHLAMESLPSGVRPPAPRESGGGPPVLLVAACRADEWIRPCMDAGAADVVLADDPAELLLARVAGLVLRHRLAKRAALNEQLAVLGRVVGGVLHEIRSPLTVVVAGVELLAGKIESPEAHRWIEPVLRNARLLRSLCEQLLEGFREPARDCVPVDLNALLVQASEFALKGNPDAHGIRSVLELQPDLPYVAAHPGKLLHVFLNLIVNARESILGGSAPGTAPARRRLGTITLRSRSVAAARCMPGGRGTAPLGPGHAAALLGPGHPAAPLGPGHAAPQVAEHVEIEVQDDGPGIPPPIAARIFEPFFTTKAAGVGFGLALARDLVGEYGGTLVAESAPGGGAVFRVRLPVIGREATLRPS